MIKAIAGNSIYIGLTKADVERMAEHDGALWFNFRDFGLFSYWACIVQKEDEVVTLDIEIIKLEPLVFCFSADALREMENNSMLIRIEGRPHCLQAYTITFFVIEDEQAGEDFVRGRINEDTIMTRRGFMPGEFPSRN